MEQVKRPPWDFASNSPSIYAAKVSEDDDEEAGSVSTSSDSWSGMLYGSALSTVHSYAPWLETSASSFFTFKRGPDVPNDAFTIGNLAHDFTRCSFDNVMFCGRESAGETGTRMRRNIVVCGVISIAGWTVVALFVSTIPGK